VNLDAGAAAAVGAFFDAVAFAGAAVVGAASRDPPSAKVMALPITRVAAMIISSRRLSDRRARGGAAAATACGCVDCAGGAETTVCGAGANVGGADGGGDSSSAAAAGVCANGGIAVEWI